MKQFLLSLAAVSMLSVSAQAQTVKFGAKMNQDFKVPASKFMKKNAAVSKPANAKLATPFNTVNVPMNMSRSGNENRDGKEISYRATGEEAVGLAPTNLYWEDLKQYGLSGIGQGAFYGGNVIRRYAGNTVSQIVFALPYATYPEGVTVFLWDINADKMLWSGVLENPKCLDPKTNNVNLNSVACDYKITGEESSLMIGWIGDAEAKSDDPYAERYGIVSPYVGVPCNQGNANYVLVKYPDAQGGGSPLVFDSADMAMDETETTYSAAFIVAFTEGENGLADYDAGLYNLDLQRHIQGEGEPAVLGHFVNMGLQPISSFEYSISRSNGQKETRTCTLEEPVQPFRIATFDMTSMVPTASGRLVDTLTVNKVNNVADEYPQDNIGAYYLVSTDYSYSRVPVLEDFTSNGAPYALGNMAYFDMLKEANTGNDAPVVIAYHSTSSIAANPLATLEVSEDYQYLVNTFVGNDYKTLVNREASVTPANYQPLVDAMKAYERCEAGIKLSSSVKDGKIVADATALFGLDVPAESYGIAFVVTEDGINGVMQANDYASYYDIYSNAGYDDNTIQQVMGWTDVEWEFIKLGRKNPQTKRYWYAPTFNNVAVAQDNLFTGTPLGEVARRQPATVTAEIPMPVRETPEINTDNLNIAALLIDMDYGYVVTGVQTKVGGSTEFTAIDQVAAGNTADITVADGAFNIRAKQATAQVYTVDGKLVSSATVNGEASLPTFGKGVYVVRVVENGHVTTKKAVF